MKHRAIHAIVLALSLSFSAAPLSAANVQPLYDGFEPIENSKAFQRYLRRAETEQSKLVYLLERFSHAAFTVLFDGYRYEPKLVAGFARVFLLQKYSGHTASVFIKEWAHRSLITGEPIKIELPNGEVRFLSDILLEELSYLEEIRGIMKMVDARKAHGSAASPESVKGA
ncbi:MAG: hypothetical protein ACOY3K_06035 [Candidatus Omnitrophota bacterium]